MFCLWEFKGLAFFEGQINKYNLEKVPFWEHALWFICIYYIYKYRSWTLRQRRDKDYPMYFSQLTAMSSCFSSSLLLLQWSFKLILPIPWGEICYLEQALILEQSSFPMIIPTEESSQSYWENAQQPTSPEYWPTSLCVLNVVQQVIMSFRFLKCFAPSVSVME